MRQIQRLHDEGLVWMDVRADAMAAYNEELQRDIATRGLGELKVVADQT